MTMHSYILNDDDTVLPTDYCRPLMRSADFIQESSDWVPESCYSGSPADTLKWYPVWLTFGPHLWDTKTVGEFQNTELRYSFQYEFMRGKPSKWAAHHLGTRYIVRHPLFHEWVETIIAKDTDISPVKKHNGKTLKDAFRYESRDTLKWFLREYKPLQQNLSVWLWIYKECMGELNFWAMPVEWVKEYKRLSNHTIKSAEVVNLFGTVTTEQLTEHYVRF